MNGEGAIHRALEDAGAHATIDPPTALFKIRFVAEALTDWLAERAGESRDGSQTQEAFLRHLEARGILSSSHARRLHELRMLGNKGVHQMEGSAGEALRATSLARGLVAELVGISAGSTPLLRAHSAPPPPPKRKVSKASASMNWVKPLPLAWPDIIVLLREASRGRLSTDGYVLLSLIVVGIAMMVLLVASLTSGPSGQDLGIPAESVAPPAPIAQITSDPQPERLVIGGDWVEWSYGQSNAPRWFDANSVALKISPKVVDGDHVAPEITVESPGYRPKSLIGETVPSTMSHRIGAVMLRKDDDLPTIIVESFTGGAHCCIHLQLITPLNGAFWSVDLGYMDGGGIGDLPKDISGDGIVDFVLRDDSFLYIFSSYSMSASPPKILNVRGTEVVDVSRDPAFRGLFEEMMLSTADDCTNTELSGRNGVCAAYVAAAARIGRFDEAWANMLMGFDRSSSWELPKGCYRRNDDGSCPADQTYSFSNYPDALLYFLREEQYLPAL